MTVPILATEQTDAVTGVLADLDPLADMLIRAVAPTETAFMKLGQALVSARGLLDTGSAHFHTLSARLAQSDADYGRRLGQAADHDIMAILSETREIALAVPQIEQKSEQVFRLIVTLDRIISEISALGINAKIHAAQIDAHGIDFSVFTKDIDRLQRLATDTIKLSSGQLDALVGAMRSARETAQAFQKDGAGELADIAGRLKGNLADLNERRERVGRVLPEIEARTTLIADRISRCISALQFNDMTSQRIDHVRIAFVTLGEAPGGEAGEVAAVLGLQARQLDAAVGNYAEAVGELRANLSSLVTDAGIIRAEAQGLFGDVTGDHSFIMTLIEDVARAASLLEDYCRADLRVRELIRQVSAIFNAIAADLSSLRSIDADLRVMGLNATLKCTRLGPAGMALGVVAHELRACSRRTEETSRAIEVAIHAAMSEAQALAERSEREYEAAAALAGDMAAATHSLRDIGSLLDTTLGGLSHACTEVASSLQGISQDLSVETRFAGEIATVSARLRAWVAVLAPAGVDPEAIGPDIQAVLVRNYTMESERRVHGLPVDDIPAPADDGIDDFFF